jgi:DNA invertase Pin-like site-specific DNA recombinase
VHEKIATGRVGIYARYSSDLQNESSIDDQARRAREAIARAGGDPTKATVFPDYAVSGGSMERPGLEALLRAVEAGRIDVIVTEDVSRVSRDMGDAAHIFKRLQFAGVPLIGLSDGIDTSAKQGKLTYAFKSMMAEWYVDELRDRTLRGLEGRALAGFATGGVPFGYRTEPEVDGSGRVLGNKIAIDEHEAPIIRRIFTEYRDDGALHRIARALNREGIPSPRAGSKHKRFGWGASTIRLVGFIADGDRSEYVVSTLRDLEAQAKAERAAIERLQREAQQPIRLPSLEEITRGAFSLENLVTGNPEQARTRIRRFLRDGEIRVIRTADGYEVRGEVFPLALAASNENAQVDQRLGHLQPDVQSNVSSGGTISTLIYAISKGFFRIRDLAADRIM